MVLWVKTNWKINTSPAMSNSHKGLILPGLFRFHVVLTILLFWIHKADFSLVDWESQDNWGTVLEIRLLFLNLYLSSRKE